MNKKKSRVDESDAKIAFQGFQMSTCEFPYGFHCTAYTEYNISYKLYIIRIQIWINFLIQFSINTIIHSRRYFNTNSIA